MLWGLFHYLLVSFIVIAVNGKDALANNQHKLVEYKTCMKHFGIATWKIVDSTTNATYYKIYNYQWNKYFPTVFPVAIFVPSSTSDVQATVKCGFRSNIQMVPNSGAHSYAALSSGTNDSIVVDFRSMKSIDINEKEESVTVGPGAFVGHLYAKLWRSGGWGIAIGNCMTVAMGGHAIGGGAGYFSSLYGLVIDNILDMKVVDARGNAVTVNSAHNTDLWWAMRGVGPGYVGIVTSIKLKMFKAKDLKLTFTRIRYRLKDFQNLLANYTKWLDWVKQNEPSVASVLFVVNDNYNVPNQPIWPGVEVQLLHIQDPKTQPNDSKAFLRAFPKFFANAIETVTQRPSCIELVIGSSFTPVVAVPQKHPQTYQNQTLTNTIIDSQLDFFSTLTKEMAASGYSFSKSFFVKKHLRSDQLKAVQDVVNEIPNNTNGIQINSEIGAVSDRRAEDMAYVHRDSLFDLRLYFDSFVEDNVAAGKKWTEKFMNATRFMDSGETYQNYPDIELKDYLSRYYGSNLRKLIQIKRKWDPNGYFNSIMSIPTTLSRLVQYEEANKVVNCE